MHLTRRLRRTSAALVLVLSASLTTLVSASAPAVASDCVPLGIGGFGSAPVEVAMPESGSVCFTVAGLGHFMPVVGSADGSWNPTVTVSYDNTEANHPGPNGAARVTYDFAESAPMQITVSGTPPAGNPGLIDAFAYNLQSHGGCTPAGDLTWGQAPQQVAFTSTQQVRCLTLDSAHPGDTLQWLDDGSPYDWVVGDDGWPAEDSRHGNTIRCTDANSATCWLGGAGPWRMLVAPGGAPGQEPLTINDFASTTGCDGRIAGHLSFKDGPVTFTRSELTQDCVLVTAAPNTLLQLAYDGGDNPDWNTGLGLYDGDGRQLCGYQVFPLSAAPGQRRSCTTDGPPPFRILTTGTAANVVNLAARRLTDPVGCTALASTPLGFDAQAFDTASVADHPCFTFAGAAGDVLRLSAIDQALGRHASIDLYNPDGSYLGVTHYYDDAGFKDFTLPQTGTYLGFLTVEAQFPVTHTTVSGVCQNPLCGGAVLGLAAVSPTTIGAARGVTLHVTGAGLTAQTSYVLSHGATQVPATSVTPGPGGRSADVRFDLAGRSGSFDLEVSDAYGNGPVTLPDAVLVQPASTPTVAMSVSSQDSYVPGRTQTVSVTVNNTSNTDAHGVPVTIGWLPPDSTITPTFPLIDPQVDPVTHEVTVEPGTWDGGVTNADGGVGAALILPTLPANSSKTFSFKVDVPDPGGYDLNVGGGSCGGPPTAVDAGPEETTDCGSAILSAVLGIVPYADCVSTAVNVYTNTIGLLAGWTTMSEIADTADVLLDGASCIADLVKPGSSTSEKIARKAVDVLANGVTANDLYRNCIQRTSKHLIPVGSHDPNYLIGPGSGSLHATEAHGLQHFELGFENSPGASAPAQEVLATVHLDPSVFDLSTLRFEGVGFGTTQWNPDPGATAIDTVIDPVRADDLTVGLTASVEVGTGEVTWHFVSRDPATLALPEDPALGFLPPDTDGVVGQATVGFDVALKEPASGTVSSTGTVVFDLNAPVQTDPWTFVVDRDTPTATVSTPARTSTGSVPVAWGSADPTADSGRVSVYVATDHGSPVLWRDRVPPGHATYAGKPGHTYTFTAQTFDQAGHGSPVAAASATTLVLRNVIAPRVRGTHKVGKVLRVSPGTWSLPGVRFSYRWLAQGKPIAPAGKASKASFRLTKKQRRKKVSVRITAAAPGQVPVVIVVRVGRIR